MKMNTPLVVATGGAPSLRGVVTPASEFHKATAFVVGVAREFVPWTQHKPSAGDGVK